VLQVRDPRRGLRVAAADPFAWQLGITPGMSISEATAIAPTIRIMDHDPQEDLEALCELAQEAWQFSPMVGLETLDETVWAGRLLHEPQGLVMDATGLDQFFGGTDQMIQVVLQWLGNKGFFATAAIHSTLGSAWAIANYSERSKIASQLAQWRLKQLIAEPMRSDASQPRGCLSKTIGIDSLSVEALRLDLKTVHTLRRLGIRTIEQLRQLPRHGLASRLGTRLIDRLDTVIANKSEPLNCFKSQPEFVCELSLEFPTSRRDTIEEVLRQLTLKLCGRLQHHGQGALRWVACLRCQKGPSHVMALGLYRPTADHQHLWPLAQSQLERQSSSRLRDIHAVSVQATLTGPLAWKQNDLFEIDHTNHHETMARLVDSLSSRLGRRGVLAPQIHPHPQPELMISWRPLTGVRANGNLQSTKRKLSTGARKKSTLSKAKSRAPKSDILTSPLQDLLTSQPLAAEPSTSDPLRRPLLLYPVPLPIEVTMTSSVIDGDKTDLKSVYFNGVWHSVLQACGPERIESGWWLGASHRRDYYRVETQHGQWWWIYRDLTRSVWYLHGSF